MKKNIDNKKRNMIIGGTVLALAVCIVGGSILVKKTNGNNTENVKETIIAEDGEETSSETTTEFVVPSIVVEDKSNVNADSKDSDCSTCDADVTSEKSTLEQEIQGVEKVTYIEHNNIPNVVMVEELDINGKVITTEKATETTTQATTKVETTTKKVTEKATQTTTKKPQVTTEKQTETTTKAQATNNGGGGTKKPQHGDINEKGEELDEDFQVWLPSQGENTVEEANLLQFSTDGTMGEIIGN